MKGLLCILITILLSISNTSNAETNRDLRHAQKLLATGDYEQAFEAFKRVASEKDNPLAKHTVAMFYDFGWGRQADPVKACLWYAQAAEGDIPVAADAYAHCLSEGIHTEVNYKQAAIWYQKAADLGHHYSLCHLGTLYITGRGVKKDTAKGLKLCQQSAEQGSVPAMLQLANDYLREDILDNEAALHWLSSAASFNSNPARYQLGIMLRDGIGTEKVTQVSLSWFELAASQGYLPAYFETAKLYFNATPNPETGLWFEHDLAKAYLWLNATLQRTESVAHREQASNMLKKVVEVMPESWNAELDAKVQAHFETITITDPQN